MTWTVKDWTPIRNGKYYCSPACGGSKSCLWKAYERAVKDSQKVLDDLGPAWRARVFENLGWHWHVYYRQGGMGVTVRSEDHRPATRRYQAEIHTSGCGQTFGWGSTPTKAVIAAWKKFQDYADMFRKDERLLQRLVENTGPHIVRKASSRLTQAERRGVA